MIYIHLKLRKWSAINALLLLNILIKFFPILNRYFYSLNMSRKLSIS